MIVWWTIEYLFSFFFSVFLEYSASPSLRSILLNRKRISPFYLFFFFFTKKHALFVSPKEKNSFHFITVQLAYFTNTILFERAQGTIVWARQHPNSSTISCMSHPFYFLFCIVFIGFFSNASSYLFISVIFIRKEKFLYILLLGFLNLYSLKI